MWCAPCSMALVPTARSAPTRTASRSSPRTPGCMRRAISFMNSHKSGAQTVSHLRFGPRPIRSPYLINSANFVGCHQFHFLESAGRAAARGTGGNFSAQQPLWPGGSLGPSAVLGAAADHREEAAVLRDRCLQGRAARLDLRTRTNTVLQTCFFAISGVLPREEAIGQIKQAIERPMARKATRCRAPELSRRSIDTLARSIRSAGSRRGDERLRSAARSCPPRRRTFVREVTARMLRTRATKFRVSLMPVDGTFPSGHRGVGEAQHRR